MLSSRWFTGALLALVLVATSSLVAQPPEPRAVSGEENKWLLGNAELIFKLNIKQMLSSSLMKNGGIDSLKEAINSNPDAKNLLDATGLDITKDIDSIVASASGSPPAETKARIIIRGRFDPTKIETALKKRDEIKISKAGATTLFEINAQDQAMFAAFADKNTLVITQSKDATLDALKNGGKKDASISKEMQAALSKFSGKESMTMAMVITDEIKKMLANVPRAGESATKLKTVTAALTLSDAIEFNLRGITGDAKAANSLSNLLEGLKGAAALAGDDVPAAVLDIVKSIKVAADKESVKVDLKVTKEMIEKAAKGG